MPSAWPAEAASAAVPPELFTILGCAERRSAGLGDRDRFRAHQQHAAEGGLQRADALTHGRRRDVQGAGGGIQRAVGHGGIESTQLREIQIHQQQC